MSGNLALFINLYTPLGTKNVVIPSGDICKVEKIGDIMISSKFTLKMFITYYYSN